MELCLMSRYPNYRLIIHPKYKYQLKEGFQHTLSFFGRSNDLYDFLSTAKTPWAYLRNGTLSVSKGYSWDGPSGPTLDTTDSIRASLVHDILYQLIALGLLPKDPWKRCADSEFLRILKEDGMPWWRRVAWYLALRVFNRNPKTKYQGS